MAKKLSEAAIRAALIRDLRPLPGLVVAEEVRLEGGAARIDVATFGHELAGYEIKSDFDSFDRMSNQIHAYNRVFSEIHLVCGCRHLPSAEAILPRWWGIHVASLCDGQVELTPARVASSHDRQDPYSVASLLSKEDALDLLRRHQGAVRAKPCFRELWLAIAAAVPLADIERAVACAFAGGAAQNLNLSLF